MRAMIVDDEPLARDGLRMLLADYEDIQLVGEAGNGADALALLPQLQPDLMFIDVQMPGMTGLELAASLPIGNVVTIVFVTAYDAFALRAFDLHALDYLLKPIDEQRFAETIRRVRARHGRRPARLTIRDGDSVVFVRIDDIDWIEAADYYVDIHAGGRSYLMRESMQRLQAQLDERFVRIHRSRLVNRDRVREVRWADGKMIVVMHDGVTLEVSRSCRRSTRRSLQQIDR